MYLQKKTLLDKKSKIKLLHVAPEKCIQKKIKGMNWIEYITIDINPATADIVMDLTELKFNNSYFDAVICNHVLEHIKDDTKAIKEISRVLKPDGWAILQVPVSYTLKKTFEQKDISTPKDREKYYGAPDHCRIYGVDYFDKLKKSGFKISFYKPNNEDIKKFILIEGEKLIFCQK